MSPAAREDDDKHDAEDEGEYKLSDDTCNHGSGTGLSRFVLLVCCASETAASGLEGQTEGVKAGAQDEIGSWWDGRDLSTEDDDDDPECYVYSCLCPCGTYDEN